jgi:hypothetical protein
MKLQKHMTEPVSRPRAADDFAVIRARLEEPRRERAGVSVDDHPRRPEGPRPYAISTRPGPRAKPGMAPVLQRMLSRGRGA